MYELYKFAAAVFVKLGPSPNNVLTLRHGSKDREWACLGLQKTLLWRRPAATPFHGEKSLGGKSYESKINYYFD